MSYRSKNIKTVSKLCLVNIATQVGSQVPSAMTRFVTFVSAEGGTTASNPIAAAVVLASAAVSNQSIIGVRASAGRKLRVPVHTVALTGIQYGHLPITIPRKPSLEPLFTIAGGKWLFVGASATSASLMVQYFEE